MLNVDFIPAFNDNYIWLVTTDPGRVAVVDPGDAAPVIAALEARGEKPEAILITHHHRDHTSGIVPLVNRYNVPVFGPAQERIPGVSLGVAEGDTIELGGGVRFQVLDTPGHTRGHVCYLGGGALFCGDTLFTGGCGRLFEGTAEQMYLSLEKLRALPDETRVYCAHEYTADCLSFAAVAEPGNEEILARRLKVEAERKEGKPTVPSLLGLEKKTNPFLRSGEPALVAAAERFAGQPLAGGAEVFGAIRRWKDSRD